jgi:hypothetical protein
MTLAQRKHTLVLACTCDRLELELVQRMRPRSSVGRVLEITGVGPWLDIASAVIGPFLPRKLRLLLTAVRVWQRAREKR